MYIIMRVLVHSYVMSETLTATHIDARLWDIFIEIEENSKTHKKNNPFVIKLMRFADIKKCSGVFEKKNLYFIIFFFFNSNLEHDLWELFLILLSVLVEDNLAELRKEDEAIPGDGVGHVGDLLLQCWKRYFEWLQPYYVIHIRICLSYFKLW